uniref:AP complex subunit sigma n=1 Tax=Periophthalmus magnuspinnatus TaxID=409849 RepID=A0A3B3ZF71_9GOBI
MGGKMRFLLLFSRQGKLRLQKWFTPLTDREKKKVIRDMMMMVLVCELDIIFNFEKAYFILDEFLMGGEILETSRMAVAGSLEEADTLQEVKDQTVYYSVPQY